MGVMVPARSRQHGVYVIEGSFTSEGLPAGGPRRVHRYGPGDSFSVETLNGR